jgi:hypothetical protein
MAGKFRSAEALFRLAWEATVGIPTNANWHDLRIASEDLAQEAPTIQPNTLNPSGFRSVGLPSKFNETGSITTDLEPQGLAYILAQIQEAGSVATLTAGQSFRHTLAPTESSLDFDKTQTLRMARSDGLLQTFLGARCSGFTVAANVRGVVTVNPAFAYERAHYWDFATVVLEDATPTRPVLRGLPKYANHALIDHDVYVKVTDITNFPTDIGLDVKVGSGSSYDTIDLRVTPTTWTEVKHPTLGQTIPGAQDTDGLGEPDSPVEIYIGALDQALSDEWRYIGESQLTEHPSIWTPTYPILSALNEIHVDIMLDAVATRFNQAQLTYARTIQPDENLGTRFADGLLVTGQRTWSGQLNRRYLSTALRKRLEAGEPFKLDMTMASRQKIGTSDDLYQLRFTSPRCIANGRTPVVPGPADFPEALGFDCYEDPTDGTDPADMMIRADNSISDLTV